MSTNTLPIMNTSTIESITSRRFLISVGGAFRDFTAAMAQNGIDFFVAHKGSSFVEVRLSPDASAKQITLTGVLTSAVYVTGNFRIPKSAERAAEILNLLRSVENITIIGVTKGRFGGQKVTLRGPEYLLNALNIPKK